ncbi:hypothetical protein AKG09_11365 [Neisseria sp. 83E34]|nr:hypothetical protein AKG09_11365 [Neisseria sp. 83E34]
MELVMFIVQAFKYESGFVVDAYAFGKVFVVSPRSVNSKKGSVGGTRCETAIQYQTDNVVSAITMGI